MHTCRWSCTYERACDDTHTHTHARGLTYNKSPSTHTPIVSIVVVIASRIHMQTALTHTHTHTPHTHFLGSTSQWTERVGNGLTHSSVYVSCMGSGRVGVQEQPRGPKARESAPKKKSPFALFRGNLGLRGAGYYLGDTSQIPLPPGGPKALESAPKKQFPFALCRGSLGAGYYLEDTSHIPVPPANWRGRRPTHKLNKLLVDVFKNVTPSALAKGDHGPQRMGTH